MKKEKTATAMERPCNRQGCDGTMRPHLHRGDLYWICGKNQHHLTLLTEEERKKLNNVPA